MIKAKKVVYTIITLLVACHLMIGTTVIGAENTGNKKVENAKNIVREATVIDYRIIPDDNNTDIKEVRIADMDSNDLFSQTSYYEYENASGISYNTNNWAVANFLAVFLNLGISVLLFNRVRHNRSGKDYIRVINSIGFLGGIFSVMIFSLTNNLSNGIVLFNEWTPIFILLLISLLAIVFGTRDKVNLTKKI